MARHVWRTTDSVIEALAKAPWRFEFAQAVRLLELARPGCTATGTSSRTDGEAVRFRSSLTTAFPASDIDSLVLAKDGGSAAMAVNFLGLAGVFGPLPASVTELLVARSRRRDTAGRDFLDIFNHRLVSL
ncbi:MAG: type VI secretion system baseplate subunit TssG, partial [Rhodospirillales bacterium]|nr:type VI secretion system baseplate subunit TssG [Rhodospirillales bacterium]